MKKQPSMSTMLLLLVVGGCVSTNATMLGTIKNRSAILPKNVAIYRTADQVPGKYEEVALLHSTGAATYTDESDMFESMRKKAAEMGANAIILDALSEPSAGAKVAGAFLGARVERKGSAIAVYVYPIEETPKVETETIPQSIPQPQPPIIRKFSAEPMPKQSVNYDTSQSPPNVDCGIGYILVRNISKGNWECIKDCGTGQVLMMDANNEWVCR